MKPRRSSALPAATLVRDVAVVRCQIGTTELAGPRMPAIRILVESGAEHEFLFSSFQDLARLGDSLARHAERLAAIAAEPTRLN